MGSPLSLIGPAISLANSAGAGKGGAQQQAPAGISPQEAALAQYTQMQGLVGVGNRFAGTGPGSDIGTGISTMATQAAGGVRTGTAVQGAGFSDANQAAQGNLLQQLAQIQGTQAGQAAAAANQGGNNQGFSPNQGSLGGGSGSGGSLGGSGGGTDSTAPDAGTSAIG